MLKQQMGIESTIAEALRAELTVFKESVELMGWKLAAFERKLNQEEKTNDEIELRLCALHRELGVSRAMASELLELIGHL